MLAVVRNSFFRFRAEIRVPVSALREFSRVFSWVADVVRAMEGAMRRAIALANLPGSRRAGADRSAVRHVGGCGVHNWSSKRRLCWAAVFNFALPDLA